MNTEEIDELGTTEQHPTYRDRVSTVTEKGKRKWVFAEKPKGWYYRLRNYFSLVYFTAFLSYH